ncbi:MAG TPA: hypothetical protein VF042_09755 [Gemmatimonadaceae bacterium]
MVTYWQGRISALHKGMAFLRLALGLTLIAFAPVTAHGATWFCSLVPYGSFYNPKSTMFIGTATADSIPSRIDNDTASGPAYGQIIRVEKLGRQTSDAIRKAVRLSSGRVVVVPWSVRSDCHPVLWKGSAIWFTPGTHGVMAYVARPRERWIAGMPTFDAVTRDVMPGAQFSRFVDIAADWATPEEILSFFEEMPPLPYGTADKVARFKAEQARRIAIREWAKKHPRLSRLEPMNRYGQNIDKQIAVAPYDTLRSPLAGTYRMTLELRGAEPVTFYVRTGLRPSSMLWSESGRASRSEFPLGYYLLSGIAFDHDSLPAVFPYRQQGYLAALLDPRIDVRDSTVWRSGIEIFRSLAQMTAQRPSSSGISQAIQAIERSSFSGSMSYVPGELVRYPDGRFVFRQPLALGQGEITGERISTVTFQQ